MTQPITNPHPVPNSARSPRRFKAIARRLAPWSWDFTSWWLATRQPRKLLGASPLAAFLFVGAVGLLGPTLYPDNQKAAHYRLAASRALAAESWDEAEIYFQKLSSLDSLDRQTAYQAALLCERTRGPQQAFQRMSRLAAEDDLGYGPAHLWIARAMLEGKLQPPDERAATACVEKHLRWAMLAMPDADEPPSLLGLHYYRQGEFDKAAGYLQTAASSDPEMAIAVAESLVRAGRSKEARRHAQAVVDRYEELAAAGANDLDAKQYQRWASAHEVLGDFDAVVATLTAGRRAHPTALALGAALGRVYFARSERFVAAGEAGTAERLSWLEKALAANPRDLMVLQRVAEMTSLKSEQAEHARQLLSPLLAAGDAPALIHTILGSLAAEQGDREAARLHLEQACRHSSTGAVALNNLAWVLMQADEPDLQRALDFANQAVARESDAAPFRETRGQILLRLERWHEAIVDLELAVKEIDLPQVHSGLAIAYEQLGDQTLAEEHRRRAAQEKEAQGKLGVRL